MKKNIKLFRIKKCFENQCKKKKTEMFPCWNTKDWREWKMSQYVNEYGKGVRNALFDTLNSLIHFFAHSCWYLSPRRWWAHQHLISKNFSKKEYDRVSWIKQWSNDGCVLGVDLCGVRLKLSVSSQHPH